MNHLHAVHQLIPLLLAIGRKHFHLRRQVQLLFHRPGSFIVFPGTETLFQDFIFFLVSRQRFFQLFHLRFQKCLLFLQLGEIFFLVGQIFQFLIHRIQIRHKLVDFPLALGRSNEKFFLIFLDFLSRIGELIAALEHEETAAHRIIGQERRALKIF